MFSSCTPILISTPLFSLHTPPYSDNSYPLCLCFSFLGLCLCITRCTLTFTSRTPPAYFVHLPYVIVSHPYVFVSQFWACVYSLLATPSHLPHAPHLLCLCFSFLGLCLCITCYTLTFTSHTPYVFVSLFLGLCFMFTSCSSHITQTPYYCCFFHFYPSFVIIFF